MDLYSFCGIDFSGSVPRKQTIFRTDLSVSVARSSIIDNVSTGPLDSTSECSFKCRCNKIIIIIHS